MITRTVVLLMSVCIWSTLLRLNCVLAIIKLDCFCRTYCLSTCMKGSAITLSLHAEYLDCKLHAGEARATMASWLPQQLCADMY